jgi:ferredoxin
MVAVDWDSCIADGACIEACPVQVYQWYRTEDDVPSAQMLNAASASSGSMVKEERKYSLTSQIQSGSMTASGAWPAFQCARLKRSR